MVERGLAPRPKGLAYSVGDDPRQIGAQAVKLRMHMALDVAQLA